MNKHFGCSRFIYNLFLKAKQDQYALDKSTISYNKCSRMTTELKQDIETSWLKEVSTQSLQQALMNLDVAYNRFFKKTSGFPKFKKKSNSKQSFEIPRGINIENDLIKIPKFNEGISINLHRKLEGKVKSATFSKTASNKYFVSILCEVPKKIKSKTGKSVGIDLGITDFIILSNGDKVSNSNFNRKNKKKLSKAQKALSRKVKESNRYNKQRVKVARIHEKITNSRKDFQHKLSTSLINEYDLISLEDLAVSNMVKNHKLAFVISDSGWSSFVTMLEYKAKWYGKEIIKINRFYPSSKTCSDCDYKLDSLPLNIRAWDCPCCGISHDRDINAAKNILRQGLKIVDTRGSCITNVEKKALVSKIGNNNEDETILNEAFKKIDIDPTKRKYALNSVNKIP